MCSVLVILLRIVIRLTPVYTQQPDQMAGKQPVFLRTAGSLLFLIVFVFLAADYARYLLEDKVIPYLEDDEALEYGEYDIFKEDDEN